MKNCKTKVTVFFKLMFAKNIDKYKKLIYNQYIL